MAVSAAHRRGSLSLSPVVCADPSYRAQTGFGPTRRQKSCFISAKTVELPILSETDMQAAPEEELEFSPARRHGGRGALRRELPRLRSSA